MDLLLGRETRDRHTLGFEVARVIGVEPTRGYLTYHARYDAGLVLWLCARTEVSADDERVAQLVDFVLSCQGPSGLWDYEAKRQASRWVTYDLLKSLGSLRASDEWLSLEPRTPFQSYSGLRKRF
jgi:hypothetical protein